MGVKKPYAMFICYPGYLQIMECPDDLIGDSYGDTKVEIGEDGIFVEKWQVGRPDGYDARLDIAYSSAEREIDNLVKERRLRMAAEANAFLRDLRTLVVPKDYYKELVEKWCKFTGKKYETACEMLGFKEE